MKHDSAAPLRSMPPLRRAFSAISIALSLVFALAAFGVTLGTSWTYQGQLRRSGAAYTGTCNFQFSLWDAASAGAQQGSTQTMNSVSVVNGLFTVVLDFGDQFMGDARWLGTSVQCSGDSGFTQLDPRQSINAAPYALSLRPGARLSSVTGPVNITGFLSVNNASSLGISGTGFTGVYGITNASSGFGVYGEANNVNSSAVYGINSTGSAVRGKSTGSGIAIFGDATNGGYAGYFQGPVELRGEVNSREYLHAESLVGDAIRGDGITGVHGVSNGAASTLGVLGEASGTNSVGIYGVASGSNTAGVFGRNTASAGIWGQSNGAGSAIYGQATSTGLAGRFTGSVVVEGNLVVQGVVSKQGGSFRIDHPLDPANKFLSHSFVESPDMKNIYDGHVITDANGSATVTLPDYFDALNRDYRYQLTVMGQFAQAIVSREVAGNSFEIQTDKPGVKVSWQVTGIRQDAYAKAKPIVVEEFKPTEEKGLYLYPAGFGAGEEKTIGYPSRPTTAPGAQNPSGGASDPASK